MKKIGTTNDGGILVEMTESDMRDLLTVGMKLTELVRNDAPVKQATIVAKPAATVKLVRVAVKASGNPHPIIKCKTCGKSFVRVRKDQTCCSVACRNKVKYPPKPATPAPKLTTVRTISDQSRLDVLRDADRRVQSRIDPVDPVEN